MDEYKTVAKSASAEFIEKRSRFIGHIIPAKTSDEAVEFINEKRAEFWDATHNVYAYVLREGLTQRYSDDGEPKGTAGVPTLEVLKKEGVSDCAVVVTRYFGGVLLGAGGLVRAYSHAAKIALDAAGIVTMAPCLMLSVKSDYNFYSSLTALITECGGIIENTDFTDIVTVTFRIQKEKAADFGEKLVDRSLGKFKSETVGECFAAVE